MRTPCFFGLDFGTTNTAVACADAEGRVTLARYDAAHRLETFRSILFFTADEREVPRRTSAYAGPAAIDRYLERDADGRLMQSIKTFLGSESFTETTIYGDRYALEDLVGLLLRRLRDAVERDLGTMQGRISVGRPVHFAGHAPERQDAIAQTRLRGALARAGFDDVEFVFEPVAAAYDYESTLSGDELVMIADFGGGTSDFSILRVGPSCRRAAGSREILAVDGVGIAGDVFDARIVRQVVSPALGLGSTYRSANKILHVPPWIYGHLERWHLLSLLRSPKHVRLLEQLRYQALEPAKLDALLRVVRDDLGFELHRVVDQVKAALSACTDARLQFSAAGVQIDAAVARDDFERWIADDVARIGACVDRTLQAAGLEPPQIDRVFMTGGSSFVPAVRRLFETRFGAERLAYGGEFVSVARGLALCARDAAART